MPKNKDPYAYDYPKAVNEIGKTELYTRLQTIWATCSGTCPACEKKRGNS